MELMNILSNGIIPHLLIIPNLYLKIAEKNDIIIKK
jgi:hypothetical protein